MKDNAKLLYAPFLKQVNIRPHATAVQFSGNKVSYEMLNSYANQISNELEKIKPQTYPLIAVAIEKSYQQIAAVLGILKAGYAYLPIDPQQPLDKIVLLLKKAKIETIITENNFLNNKLTEILTIDINLLKQNEVNYCVTPNKNSALAYVIFTSGSTGEPKGVMLDHQGPLNTIEDINDRFRISHEDKILSLSALTFDLSVYDIFGIFAAGGTLVLPETSKLKEPSVWADLIIKEKITIWNSVPTTMQMLVEYLERNCEAAHELSSSSLRLVLLSGDWLPLNLPNRIRAIFNNVQVVSLGGATEASIWSILYPIQEINPQWKSIPYGAAMKNQKFYILNSDSELVNGNEPGELYIGGVGLAKGYWQDENKTKARFIEHPTLGRIYKTGDRGRYLPDGNIEFLGRLEQQVKVRGFWVALNAIENQLMEERLIKQAIVTSHQDRQNNTYLTAFLIKNQDAVSLLKKEIKDIETKFSKTRIAQWQKIFHEIESDTSSFDGLPFNTSGWISSYTKKPLPAIEMQEWVVSTVSKILALKPNKLLEIGCGTGLLLFRLEKEVEFYHATDISASALDYIKSKEILDESKNVILEQRVADDFSGLKTDFYDTIILNSIVQYFPSHIYFIEVLNKAIALVKDGGKIFIGDVRNLSLANTFYASMQIFKTNKEINGKNFQLKLEQQYANEQELFIDPDFFSVFGKQHPKIDYVDIQLKRGKHFNEMSCFRYDVILHIKGANTETVFNNITSNVVEMDFTNYSYLETFLIQNNPSIISIKGLKNARLLGYKAIMDYLSDNNSQLPLTNIQTISQTALDDAVDPECIWSLADKYNYKALLSYSDMDKKYCFEAIFYHSELDICKVLKFFQENCSNGSLTWDSYFNAPIEYFINSLVLDKVKSALFQKLPDYMVPSKYIFLQQFPVNTHGKINRNDLVDFDTYESSRQLPIIEPRTAIETLIYSIWSNVLKISEMSIHDKFHELGGTSLLAVQIAIEIKKKLKIDVNIKEITSKASSIYFISKLLEKKHVI